MVEVVMMLFLPLLALALAIPPKRSTSALGVFVSIVMVVAYHKVNEYGQSIASLGRMGPTVALWGPFAIFALIILWMYYRVAFVPGAQAIGALETAFAKLAKWLKRIMRRRSRSHQMGMMSDAV
jgi:lipopolysaccharide export system permease protein